jgi:Protein of unknown function (DUF2735)
VNTNANQGSAKIYQFPTNAAERSSRRAKPTSDLGLRPAMAVGESWYHQDAVEEETRANSVVVPFDFPRQ